jgi:nitroreductase
MDFFKLIRARRSIRAYQPRAVEEDKLKRILEAANAAPSAGNLQAYAILIVRDAGARQALSRAALGQESLVQVPVVLAFFSHPQSSMAKYKSRGVELYSLQDATIACAYAQLAATAQGLATVWVGAFDDAGVRAVLKVPSDWRPVALLPIGYADESPTPTPRRSMNDLAKEASELSAGGPK